MAIQLTNAAVIINNEAVGVIPNSVEFDEGRGEQVVRAVVVDDGKLEQVYAENLETNLGAVKFSIPSTVHRNIPESVVRSISTSELRSSRIKVA